MPEPICSTCGRPLDQEARSRRDIRIGHCLCSVARVGAPSPPDLVSRLEGEVLALRQVRAALEARAETAEAWIDAHECEDVAKGALDAQEDAEKRLFAVTAERDAALERAERAEAELARYTGDGALTRGELSDTLRQVTEQLRAESEALERAERERDEARQTAEHCEMGHDALAWRGDKLADAAEAFTICPDHSAPLDWCRNCKEQGLGLVALEDAIEQWRALRGPSEGGEP